MLSATTLEARGLGDTFISCPLVFMSVYQVFPTSNLLSLVICGQLDLCDSSFGSIVLKNVVGFFISDFRQFHVPVSCPFLDVFKFDIFPHSDACLTKLRYFELFSWRTAP